MDMPDQLIEGEQLSAGWREPPNEIEKLRRDVEAMRRRLDRLAKLQTLIKEKYRKRLSVLLDQLDATDKRQNELGALAKQLKKHKERREILNNRIVGLVKRKKTINETIKQVMRYEKSSSAQVGLMEEEQEILYQRVQDLTQALELAGQAELNDREADIVRQRVCATKESLEEHEADLRKRTIDLLFEFYVPPKM